MSYISISIMLITIILKKLGNLNSKFALCYPASSLIFIVAILPSGIAEIRFVENYVFKYFSLILLFVISFLVLLFANIKHNRLKSPNKESELLNEN